MAEMELFWQNSLFLAYWPKLLFCLAFYHKAAEPSCWRKWCAAKVKYRASVVHISPRFSDLCTALSDKQLSFGSDLDRQPAEILPALHRASPWHGLLSYLLDIPAPTNPAFPIGGYIYRHNQELVSMGVLSSEYFWNSFLHISAFW